MRSPPRLLAALLALLLLAPHGAKASGLTIFAAASLREALGDIAAAWTSQGHAKPSLDFAASSTLARQIDAGAPANLFASADEKWMDWAQQRHLIVPDTRRDVLGNTLVLVVPKDRARSIAIGPQLDLAKLLQGGRLAVGDPRNVPCGIYTKQAFQKLGLWDQAAPHLAPSADVRAALLLVERGEAPAGVVYATDAAASPGVAVAGVFPDNTHDPIVYPFAVASKGDTPEARAFLAFLGTDQAKDLLRARGFATR